MEKGIMAKCCDHTTDRVRYGWAVAVLETRCCTNQVIDDGKSVLGHQGSDRWDRNSATGAHKKRYDKYKDIKYNKYQNKQHVYTDLMSHTQKEKFMVGFNYLEHQIKRTKRASLEYVG